MDDDLIARIIVFETLELPEITLSEKSPLKPGSHVVFTGDPGRGIEPGAELTVLASRPKIALVSREVEGRTQYAVVTTDWLAPALHTRDRKARWL